MVIPPFPSPLATSDILRVLASIVVETRDGGLDVNALGHELIHAFNNRFFHRAEGTDFSDAVPGVKGAGLAADRFIPFEETGHEKFFGKGGEFDAAPFAV